MRIDRMLAVLFVFLLIVVFSQNTFAQKFEIYPYAGGFWPADLLDQKFANNTMVGIKGGFRTGAKIEWEGNFGYINHFKFVMPSVANVTNLNNINIVTFSGTGAADITPLNPNNVVITQNDPEQRGYLWEFNANYNFLGHKLGAYAEPYVTGGIGGTTVTRNEDFATNVLITQGGLSTVQRVEGNLLVNRRIDDASVLLPPTVNTGSYLTFNYGGGIKGQRLWGPVGLRADFIGRVLPNFVGGKALNAFQLTGGVTFAFGEP
jgi:opacity protein-like surface antigen